MTGNLGTFISYNKELENKLIEGNLLENPINEEPKIEKDVRGHRVGLLDEESPERREV